MPRKVYYDNKSAISIAHNPVQRDKTKDIEIDEHFIKEKLDSSVICISYMPITSQLVDVLIKGLSNPGFQTIIVKLGMDYIYLAV